MKMPSACKCPYCGNTDITDLDEFKVNYDLKTLFWKNGMVALTPSEAIILEMLLKANHEAVSKEDIIMEIYIRTRHADDPPDDKTFAVQLSNLRRKLRNVNCPLNIKRGSPWHNRVTLDIKPHEQQPWLLKERA